MTLTAAELAVMRSTLDDLLPDTCNIISGSATADGEGGWTTTWSTASTSIACRLDVIQGREQMSGGAIQAYTSYMLTLPYDTTVAAANRVQLGSDTYAVKSVNLNQSWKAVVRVELEKL